MIKIALLQLLPAGSLKENMAKGLRYCKEAKRLGADIALFPEMWSCGYHIPHGMEQLDRLAVSADSAFVTAFGSLAKELDMAIATCNYPAPHPDCNGHSTLFVGVVYLPELSGSRDTCVLEADESEGVFLAGLDVDMLREYRKRERPNLINRRPELYGILTKNNPFPVCRSRYL